DDAAMEWSTDTVGLPERFSYWREAVCQWGNRLSRCRCNLLRRLGSVLHRRPVLVGAGYVFSFVLAPLSRPIFGVIHIEFAVDDRERLGIDRVLVTILVGDAHGAMAIILRRVLFGLRHEEIEVLLACELPARVVPHGLKFEPAGDRLSLGEIGDG